MMHNFSLRFWCGYLHQPKKYYNDSLSFNFDFDISVANAVVIDVAKCTLPGKVMQWSPCPEACTLTNEDGRYIINGNNVMTCVSKLKVDRGIPGGPILYLSGKYHM